MALRPRRPRRRPSAAGAARPGPTEELAALDDLGAEGTWDVFGTRAEAHQPRQGAVPRARRGEDPVTKRDLIRATSRRSRRRRCPTSRTGRSTCTASPTASTSQGFWHKEVPDHAPDWLPRWRQPGRPTRARPSRTSWSTAGGAGVGRELRRRSSCIRGRRAPTTPERPTYALIDLDPGERTTWDELLVLARLHRTALEHLGVRGAARR